MIFTFSKIFDFTQFDCLKTCFVAKCKVCSVQFHHIASRFSFRIHRVKLGRASNNAKSVWVPYFCQLYAAVALLPCLEVNRHAARVMFLEYVGEGPIDTTLMLVGKVCTCEN